MANTQPTSKDIGGNILGAAFMQYGQGTGSYNTAPANLVKNPSAQYEYGIPTNNPATTRSRLGKDTDGDGFREVDCSTLVFNGLRNAGYQIPGAVANSEAIPFSTGTLFNKDGLTAAADQNFNKVAEADLKPGDIVLFRPTTVGNAQHIGIYYGQDSAGNMMFYGSQSSTGPDIATVKTGNDQNYWGGAGAIFAGALRPKPELYVPEMDLTGGAGTGLSSDKVIAAVNLLKSSNVEGYRANIYSNNAVDRGDGVPTVGNGFALVVKGSSGWVIRPENEIRDLLRDAGLPESKYNELPFDKLKESASLLNQGRQTDARALFGVGDSGGFSVTPAEADKLSASFVIRNVIPSIVKSFGDAESFALLEPGEFAAAASKVYQSPGWLQSALGQNFIDAWWADDMTAIQAALGTGLRGSAEASAYGGTISTTNEYLSAKNTSESGSNPVATPGSNWQDRTIYDIMTGLPIGVEDKVRIDDGPKTTAAGAETRSIPAANSAPTSTQQPTPETSSSAPITTVAGAKGDQLTFKFANGKQIKVGDDLNSPDGSLVSFDSVKDSLIIDVKIGDNLYERRTYGGSGKVSSQSWEFIEDQLDDETGQPTKYFNGDVYQVRGDTYVFTTGIGLVHQGTGDVAATPPQIKQFIEATPTLPLVPIAYVTVVLDGQVYETNPNGTIECRIPYHPDWLESRDSTGAGLIIDRQGNTIAQLQKGDRLGQMDDGRIKIDDIAGKAVNRLVDDAFSDAFVAPAQAHVGQDTASNSGVNGSDLQSDQYFQVAKLQAPALATHFAGSGTAGAFGAGQIGGFDVLPFNKDSSFLVNADGDIAGEINRLGNGYVQIKDLGGNIAYVNAQTGQALSSDSYDKAQSAFQTAQVGSALGLMQSIIGLDHWEHMSDLQRVATVASIYNAVDKISGGNALPGDLGSAVAVLGFLNALDKGDVGGIVYSGLSLVETLTSTATQVGWVTDTLGADFLPGLGFALALDSGDPYAIASSGISLGVALGAIPGWGTALAIGISILGGLLSEIPDIPMREGIAHAEWDAAGNTQVITDQDIEDGGATAAGWMSSLVHGLQTQLANTHDSQGNSYALVPNLLPGIGFQYDPDGFNLGNGAKGFMVLRWTDEMGQSQTRYYDGAGSRGDGSGETLAGDFMAHAKAAIAPDWQVATTLARFQQGLGIVLPATSAGLPQATGDGIHQSLQALSLSLPAEPVLVEAFVDIDGDGYLEQSQWLSNNQNVLAIDINGNDNIDAGELLSLNGAGLNSLNWLDANGDKLIDARDPAFAALRLWIDVNSDGGSDGETQGLTQAGINAIDFASNPPAIVHADGSRTTLTVQTLTASILGTRYQNTEGGILQLDEQRNADSTLGVAAATLHAVNTRQFDGQAAYINGGLAAATTRGASNSVVEALDTRLSSTSARTIANQSAQTRTTLNVGDSRLQNGVAGTPQIASTAVTATVIRSNALAFVPLAGTGAAQEQRQVLDSMIRSASSSLFDTVGGALPLVAFAAGATAVQWPTVANAASNDVQDSNSQVAGRIIIADQARNDGQIAYSPDTTTVVPDLIRDTRTADQVRSDSYQSTSYTSSNPGTPNNPTSPVQSSFELSSQLATQQIQALAITDLPAQQKTASLTTNLIPDQNQGSGASAQASQTSTFTTAAGVLLDYPRTQGERANGVEDTSLRFAETQLLANDSTVNAPAFPNQPSLRITSVFEPLHGSVALQMGAGGTTQVIFTPDANYHGPASFSYTVTDQYGLSSQATITLSIAAVNDAPVTQGEAASGDEDTAMRFTAASLLANDSDVDTAVDGDVLRITRIGSAEHGQVFLAADGTVSFVPDLNYNGLAQFNYWVGDRIPSQIATAGNDGDGFEVQATMRLTILPVNDLPVVTGETLASDEDIVLNINPALLLANDTDVDVATNNQVLSISTVNNAQHGAVVLLPDGNLQFRPERDYFGAAGFSYTVSDGNGGLVVGQVIVNLAAVNDAPLLIGETIVFNEDDIQTISAASLLSNDTDVDNPHSDLRIISVGNATHGSVALNPDGSIRFAPDADYFGPALFTYTVSDGSGGFSVGTATLDIAPVNDAPRLLGESLTLDEDTQARFSLASLLANDTDVDNTHSELTITSAVMDTASAPNGSVSISNGQIIFTPTLNFNGQASFSYSVSDGMGGVSQASVNLIFNPINDAPVANSELVFGKKDISYTLTQAALLANDTDVDTPNSLRIGSISNMQHGSAILAVDGSVRFTPTAGYDGRGSFDYVVMDPDGATSTATAQIDFSRVNTSPITTDDSFIGFEDVPFIIAAAQLLVNERDADNALADLRVTAVDHATNGTVSLQTDGSVRFVANANFYGNAIFVYQVSDGDGGLTWATAQLTVQSVNDAPVIEDIWYGRPVYGTTLRPLTTDELGNAMTYGHVNVTVESQALSLLASGLLVGSSGSYYQNGHLRPVAFTSLDATAVDEFGTVVGTNTPYREQGGIVAYDPDGNSSQISFSLATTPQHGHAWTNQYTSINAPYSADHTQIFNDWIAETGAWQYFSQRGDPYSGGDPFNITVTDAQGASTNVNISPNHTGSSAAGGGGKKPVTLDLNGNGLHYIGIDDSKAYFDINNDGWREHLAWIAPDDGLLVLDTGGDSRIDRYDEISFTSYLAGAKTDLEGLAAFDSNHDGLLSRLDTRWKEFAVWQDGNSDGVSDSGEVRTLDDIGIAQIGLASDHQIRIVNGVTEHGQAQFTWTDSQSGQTGAVGDVSLPFDLTVRLPASGVVNVTQHGVIAVLDELALEGVLPPLIEPLTMPSVPTVIMPTPMQMALVMTQMINAMSAPDSAPLIFIPTGSEVEPQQALEQAQDNWEQVARATPLEMAHA